MRFQLRGPERFGVEGVQRGLLVRVAGVGGGGVDGEGKGGVLSTEKGVDGVGLDHGEGGGASADFEGRFGGVGCGRGCLDEGGGCHGGG